MGEHADMAVYDIITMELLRQDYRLGLLSNEDAYDLNILDEHGMEISDNCYRQKTSVVGRQNVSGAGNCPLCNCPTVLRKGKYGNFYGCSNFPSCKGSRNL